MADRSAGGGRPVMRGQAALRSPAGELPRPGPAGGPGDGAAAVQALDGVRAVDAAPVADDAAASLALRQALGRFATGVTVVTCRGAGGEPVGLTVNSFASLSLAPPLLLWSLRCESTLLAEFEASGHFAVNVLAADQIAVSQRFASPVADKFVLGHWHEGLARLPLLEGSIARFECAVEARHPHGDHVLYIGRVLRMGLDEGEPLLYHGSRYHHLGAAR